MKKTKKRKATLFEVPEWAEGARWQVPAETAHQVFQRIQRKHGSLTNQHILDEAKSPRSPIHKAFEWDDAKAGNAYRLAQASEMRRALIFRRTSEEDDRERVTRAWVPISRRDDGDAEVKRMTWMTMEDAMTDPVARAELIDRALAEVRAWQMRYADVKELAGIFAAIGAHTVAKAA